MAACHVVRSARQLTGLAEFARHPLLHTVRGPCVHRGIRHDVSEASERLRGHCRRLAEALCGARSRLQRRSARGTGGARAYASWPPGPGLTRCRGSRRECEHLQQHEQDASRSIAAVHCRSMPALIYGIPKTSLYLTRKHTGLGACDFKIKVIMYVYRIPSYASLCTTNAK